jgi:hypothetical protein
MPENLPWKLVVDVSEVIVNVAGSADVMHTSLVSPLAGIQ